MQNYQKVQIKIVIPQEMYLVATFGKSWKHKQASAVRAKCFDRSIMSFEVFEIR